MASVGEHSYAGEGWGLTTDGTMLLLSDGSHQIRVIDPATFLTSRTIEVLNNGSPVTSLNELEFAKGEIFANIWHDDRIVRIDPASGRVLGWLDMNRLHPRASRANSEDVLNGIAYDAQGDRFFVTGKRWPKLFEIKLRQVPPSCYVIRRIGYPIRARRAREPSVVRLALLDICPRTRGMAARPMIEVNLKGKRTMAEFEVVSLFDSEQSATDYALTHGIMDVELR
jgi:hypothetical protein